MKRKILYAAVFTLLAIGTMGSGSCTDFSGPNLLTQYKNFLNGSLGTNYVAWADYALSGKLGMCILAKPPIGTPFAERCSYYIRSGATNAQGLNGYPNGTGCIPNRNFIPNLFGVTYTTYNSGIAYVSDKDYAGHLIANLINSDTTDNQCKMTGFIQANMNRLNTFNTIDYTNTSQMNHVLFSLPSGATAFVCAYELPDPLPLTSGSGSQAACQYPLFVLSPNFCNMAYNRYILNHAGVAPPTIDYGIFQTRAGYSANALLTTSEAVSSLSTSFSIYDEIPWATDIILLNSSYTKWSPTDTPTLTYSNYQSVLELASLFIIKSAAFGTYTSETNPAPVIGQYAGALQSKLSPDFVAAMLAVYNTAPALQIVTENAFFNTPTAHIQGLQSMIIPNYNNPLTINTFNLMNLKPLAFYALPNPPQVNKVPFDLINSGTVSYYYGAGTGLPAPNPIPPVGYLIANTPVFGNSTPHGISALIQTCSNPPTWAASIGAPVMNTSFGGMLNGG